jgi:hypothetical protein
MLKFAVPIAVAFSNIACGQECLAAPCPVPMALAVAVSSSGSGGPVSGATVAVSGATTTTVPCDSSCLVPGYAGSYTLTASAPGYQTVERTVLVQGSSPACGCATARTEHISLVLTPVP